KGFRTLEMKAAGPRTYITLCKMHQSSSLPSTSGNLLLQFQSLTHILQVRVSNFGNPKSLVPKILNRIEESDDDDDWLYNNCNVDLDDETLAFSP
ncbi:hypothetical protein BGX26_008766, partial [Mortierella sp. AD094]